MSELRLNPLTGRWVTVVATRAERPSDFAPRITQIESDPDRPCPFCPGLASADEIDIAERSSVRVVPNLYPAFVGDEPMAVVHEGPVFVHATASGVHEVLVFSGAHHSSWADLDDEAAGSVMTTLGRRLAEHSTSPRVRYTQAIVNHGREAGASMTHPHGQLLGMPFVPGEILEEERGFARFEGSCLMCTTVEAELNADQRVVYADDHVLVICPYWSGSPYELLIIPVSHNSHLQRAESPGLEAVGVGVRNGLAMLRSTLGDVAYNLVFHTAPHRHDGNYHWHAHVWPKLVTVAGFERGTGVMINITPPESAAADLRRATAAV
jgi:UDPglucose--hexose-1-phosphate uridylyltransferase